jgi:predicted nucleotidyltransferase
MNAGLKYLPQLVEKLKQADPYKIILFGSYASGTPDIDSDIDILVVTSDQFMPKNYDEKMQVTLKISRLISAIKAEHPIDLIVQTLPMHQKFIAYGSMFSKEILKNGKVLYERNHEGLA